MTALIFFLLVLVIFSIILIVFSKPLTVDQIIRLAQKRRSRRIQQYFSSSILSYSPSKHFKSSLKPDGKLYQVDLDMSHVPSFVANLLKYKKHEWSVIAFIGNRKARYLWANKGPDRSRVDIIPVNFVIRTAKENDCDVIMTFHNHPAYDPQHYSYYKPSSQDLQSAEIFSQALNAASISYLDHVCERGRPYRYCLKSSDMLYPLTKIQDEVKIENAGGRLAYIKLHFELYL